MAYATIDDVQQRMPQFQLSATSKPALSQAEIFLSDSQAHLDAALTNLGYVVPITGAMSLPQVREAVCDRAICRILYARAAALGTDSALQSAEKAGERYDKFLADLANDKSPVELVDAARTDSAATKGESSGPFALLYNTRGEEIEPRICIDSRVCPMGDF